MLIDSDAQAQKESWIKKSWNNMVAHYNIYFNAEQKLKACMSRLANKQKDDFNSIINGAVEIKKIEYSLHKL